MPEDKKEFHEEDPQLMQLITDGTWPFDCDIYKNKFKLNVLQQAGTLDVLKAANGLDGMTKFPAMKFETVSRALTHVNGRELPSLAEAKKFLNKLPDLVVDMLYLEYDTQKNLRDNKIKQMILDLKNSSRGQSQEGTGGGQSASDPSGSESSTPDEP